MLNGAHKKLSNLLLSFIIYLRDTTLEVVSKSRLDATLVAVTHEYKWLKRFDRVIKFQEFEF